MRRATDAQWYAEMEFKRDAAARAYDAEIDLKKRRSLRGRRDHYKGLITMGPARASEASAKARQTMRGNS